MSRCYLGLAGLLFASFAAGLAGCSSDAAPITAENSKFRPVAAGGEGAAETPAGSLAPAGTPATEGKPPAIGFPEGATDEQKIEQLVSHLDRLALEQPQGATQQEQMANFIKIQQDRLNTGRRIMAMKADAATRLKVAKDMEQMLLILARFGQPGMQAEQVKLAKTLADDADPALARQGRHMQFRASISTILKQELENGQPIVAAIKKLLDGDEGNLNVETLELATSYNEMLLLQNRLTADAVAALKLTAAAGKTSQDPKVVTASEQLADQAQIMEFFGGVGPLLSKAEKGDAAAADEVVEKFGKMLTEVSKSQSVLDNASQIGQFFEQSGHAKAAVACYEALDEAFKDGPKNLAASAAETLAAAKARTSLIGQPIAIEGQLLDGKPFDWSAYAGKVVLVDFWATWCGPCIEEMPNIAANYDEFHAAGFDVVGVNVDTDLAPVKDAFSVQELPWKTVTSQEALDGKFKEDPKGFSKLPMSVKFGVKSLPFLVLVGKDGKVDSLQTRGPKLRERLVALLGEPKPAEKPATEKPAGDKPAEKPTAEEKPAAEKPAADKPAEKPAEEKPAVEDKKPAAEEKKSAAVLTPASLALVAALLGADPAAPTDAANPPAAADDPAINPYAAKPGLSSGELVQYILKMLDKPKTIQTRPGFSDAVVNACDRVLAADPPAKETEFLVAAESKFDTLHKEACAGNDNADKELQAFVEKMAKDERPRIARPVAFFQQERKVLSAVDGPVEAIPALLTELKEYFAKEKLAAKHLRMASSTVALVNKLADGDEREKHFAELGGTFAKSTDKELARYGKKLAQKPEAEESDLVGKPLELAGTTAKGDDFAWKSYRGKVVLVDFWATWCGPCRKEMPNVKALYEKLKDKGFAVVGVSLDQDLDALAEYIDENQIPWQNLSGDGTQELASKYGVRGIPTMMAIDKDGKILGVAHNVAALVPIIEKQLGAAAAK